jgi:FlaA1/EpsC-like NDP-sugar epimerase
MGQRRPGNISANFFSHLFVKPIKVLGWRQGEKLHECLVNDMERQRAHKHGNYWVIEALVPHATELLEMKEIFTSEKCRPFSLIQSEIEQIIKLG